ncbi:MAG: sodium:alanine symporter family protein, partial [Lentisphaeria bacterium]|nr:sodium:alanine symporter family protein [Lentisphaeria bacterium]
MDTLQSWVTAVNSSLSDYVLTILLAGFGIYISIRTKFVQIRCFSEGWRSLFSKFSIHGGNHGSGFTPFQALATAVAAQVGTGNIVGASGAILTGGPGAIFWMWVIAFFGMATSYSETILAQETRVKNPDGSLLGGPVFYIKRAFPNRFGKYLAIFFAIATIAALGIMGCMVQANSIGETCKTAFNIPSWIVGIAITAFAGFIFIGGNSRLASVTE